MREFTLYLSTRWDMVLEREAFKTVAAPALKEILDSRGVTFGYMDVRSDMSTEDLQTPKGINAVLVSLFSSSCFFPSHLLYLPYFSSSPNFVTQSWGPIAGTPLLSPPHFCSSPPFAAQIRGHILAGTLLPLPNKAMPSLLFSRVRLHYPLKGVRDTMLQYIYFFFSARW